MPLFGPDTECAAIGDWNVRLATKAAISGTCIINHFPDPQKSSLTIICQTGGVGALVGTLLSIRHHRPILAGAATATASYLIVGGWFFSTQELCRVLRRKDTPVNSAIAGCSTGALLFQINTRPAALGAALCGTIGFAAHHAADAINVSGSLRQLLVTLDLLDDAPHIDHTSAVDSESTDQSIAHEGGLTKGYKKKRSWLEYVPGIKKMSDEEWELYKAEQDDAHIKEVEAALAGGLPAFLKRQKNKQNGD